MRYRRLRDLREDHDLTQTELAQLLNCSQQTYSKYERGAALIPTECLIILADYCHTSVDYILERVKNP